MVFTLIIAHDTFACALSTLTRVHHATAREPQPWRPPHASADNRTRQPPPQTHATREMTPRYPPTLGGKPQTKQVVHVARPTPRSQPRHRHRTLRLPDAPSRRHAIMGDKRHQRHRRGNRLLARMEQPHLARHILRDHRRQRTPHRRGGLARQRRTPLHDRGRIPDR